MLVNTDAPACCRRAKGFSRFAVFIAPLAAFLAIVIQLLLAKHLLPLYGNGRAVWLGSSLFFLLGILSGCIWAAWLLARTPRVQTGATILLSVVAVFTTHLPTNTVENPGILFVVGRLALSSLPAMILLCSAPLVLHRWAERQAGNLPGHFYTLVNAGGLVALVGYPFLIEPETGLTLQYDGWKALFSIVAAVLAIAGFWLGSRTADTAPVHTLAMSAPSSGKTILAWLLLSALGVLHLLAATHQIAGEIGYTSLAWTGPSGLYLLGFAFAFSGRWRIWMTRFFIAVLAVALGSYMVVKGFTAATIAGPRLWWLLAVSGSGGFITSALLHHLRPERRSDLFYLVSGAGGALGGLASTYMVPWLFTLSVEFTFTALAILLAGLFWLLFEVDDVRRMLLAVVVCSPVLIIGLHQRIQRNEGLTSLHLRDATGSILVESSPGGVVLSSETTIRGSRLAADKRDGGRPTLYYTESGGSGRVLTRLQDKHSSLRYGVVGLGAGTLAAYTRATDICDFWDIDPKLISVAHEHFTYLRDAKGTVNVMPGDGRQALATSTEDYDVLIVDAFQGDHIPSHLLTREAMKIYSKRLSARQGVLLIHTTGRYGNYFPPVDATARSLGLAAFKVITTIDSTLDDTHYGAAFSEYIVISPPTRFMELAKWFPDEENCGAVRHSVFYDDAFIGDEASVWTDDHHSILTSLNLGAWIRGD